MELLGLLLRYDLFLCKVGHVLPILLRNSHLTAEHGLAGLHAVYLSQLHLFPGYLFKLRNSFVTLRSEPFDFSVESIYPVLMLAVFLDRVAVTPGLLRLTYLNTVSVADIL